jgi:hypothetical protein
MMTASSSYSKQQSRLKGFTCFRCGSEIKLKRKADNSGWIRLNLDNATEHRCPPPTATTAKKQQQGQQQQQPTITSSSSTAAAQAPAAPATSSLERKLDHLIAEVQALRMDLQKKK